MEKREFSSRTIWMAINSEYGDRLVEITREHTQLARDLIVNRLYLSDQDREIYKARIEALRAKRDLILEMFEEK